MAAGMAKHVLVWASAEPVGVSTTFSAMPEEPSDSGARDPESSC